MGSARITIALGPWAGAAMADAFGSYANAFLGIAALGLLSVAFALFSTPRPVARSGL